MIIIATYNERQNISPIISRIRKVLPSVPIVFVDDSSPDGTAEEIRKHQGTDQNIELILRPRKSGFASAHIAGLHKALQSTGDFVITMDGDLSHPPEILPEMIDSLSNHDLVIGSRYVKGGSVKNWSLRRKILSRAGNLYASAMLNIPLKDTTSGFMGMRKDFLKEIDLSKIRNTGYAYLMEIKNLALHKNPRVKEIAITFSERVSGESKLGSGIIAEGIRYPLKSFINRQVTKNYIEWLLFLASFIIYAWTLPKTMFLGDSAEFMVSAATLGIPHPPGYPLYVLVGKIFSFLPFGNLEFRIGLFSAVCASLVLVLFYHLSLKFFPNRLIAFGTALVLGFTNLFWSQAIMAKVYMPTLLIILVILTLAIKYWETYRSKYLIWIAFLFGLGSGMHQMIFLFLPIIVYLMFVGRVNSWKTILSSGASLTVGILVYGFLFLRAQGEGFYSFPILFDASRTENINGLWHYFLRSDYQDYGGGFSWKDKLLFFGSAMQQLWQEFSWLVIFIPIGIVSLWNNQKLLVLSSLVFSLNILGIILVRSASFSYENDVMHSYYNLPAITIAAFWIGAGIYKLLNRKQLALAVLIVPLVFLVRNHELNNQRDFTFSHEYTASVLTSLEPNAVLLVNFDGANTDTITFGLHFQQFVNNLRPDVQILTVYQMYPHVDRKALAMVYSLNDPKHSRYHLTKYALKYFPQRPIYTTYIADSLDQTWHSESNGLVYRLNGNSTLTLHELDWQKDHKILESNMYGQDLLTQYFYTQAAYWLRKDNVKAHENHLKAIEHTYKLKGIDQAAYIAYRTKVLME